MFPSIARIVCVTGFLVVGLVQFVPTASGATRMLLLLGIILFWIGGIGWIWKRKTGRTVLLILPLLGAALFFLPAGNLDQGKLRSAYVSGLLSFHNVPYHWGGEGRRGIDCSGLPRRAFRDALMREGLKAFDGGSLRAYARQWWFDASALALRDGYRDFVVPLGIRGTVRTIDATRLLPGDLAITGIGNHVLVYLGDGRWIQASPGEGKVVIQDPATSDDGWFDSTIAMFRWRELAE